MYHSFYSSDAPLIVLAVINLAIGLASLFAVIEDHRPSCLPSAGTRLSSSLACFCRPCGRAFSSRASSRGSWPLTLIFLWLGIFLFELTAVVSSWLRFALLVATNSKTLL